MATVKVSRKYGHCECVELKDHAIGGTFVDVYPSADFGYLEIHIPGRGMIKLRSKGLVEAAVWTKWLQEGNKIVVASPASEIIS